MNAIKKLTKYKRTTSNTSLNQTYSNMCITDKKKEKNVNTERKKIEIIKKIGYKAYMFQRKLRLVKRIYDDYCVKSNAIDVIFHTLKDIDEKYQPKQLLKFLCLRNFLQKKMNQQLVEFKAIQVDLTVAMKIYNIKEDEL